jgi:Restriction endonuclease
VKAATSNAEKGRTLENLLAWFFEQFEGISVLAKNLSSNDQELDLVLFNEQECPVFRAWDQIILVEAKNWSTAVDAATVAWFYEKMEMASAHYGILVARSGVTGMTTAQGGATALARTKLAKGFRLIVLTLVDFEGLSSIDDFLQLLRAKLCQGILGQL